MRKSLKFIAVPLLALSLAGISSAAMAASQPSEEQKFSGGGWKRENSLMEARSGMRDFESTHSVECTETSAWSTQIVAARMWISYVHATCVAANA